MTLIITQPTNLGYFQRDERASGGENFEAPTYTCTHCERVVVMHPERKRERAYCTGCNHMICDGCGAARAAGAPCRTYAQHLDELAERETRLILT